MKGYQTELINKEEEADELDEDVFDPTSTCRGTKLFIEQMNKSVKKNGR